MPPPPLHTQKNKKNGNTQIQLIHTNKDILNTEKETNTQAAYDLSIDKLEDSGQQYTSAEIPRCVNKAASGVKDRGSKKTKREANAPPHHLTDWLSYWPTD